MTIRKHLHAHVTTDVGRVGRALRELRQRSRITQREMSEKTGLSINFLSLVENGRRGIGAQKLGVVANVLGVPKSFLHALAEDPRLIDDPAAKRLLVAIQGMIRETLGE